MEIRRLEEQDRTKAKELWEEVFAEDKGKFTDWFFDVRFRPERCFGVFAEDGLLLSMAHLAQVPICIRGRQMPSNFFQGVATRKSEEGKGYASSLQKFMLQTLYEEGAEVAALNTFIHPFYERMGFATYAFKSEERVLASHVGDVEQYEYSALVPLETLEAMTALYQEKMREYNGWIVRDAAYFRTYLTDCLDISGCTLLISTLDGEFCGYAIVKEEDAVLRAVEAVYRAPEALEDFASAAGDRGLEAFCYPSFDTSRGAPGAMLRVVNVKKLADQLPLEEGECAFGIQDPVIKQNNATWHFFSQNGKVKATPTRTDASIQLTIGEFAKLAMGMDFVMSGIDASIHKVKRMFSRCKRGIFEQY